MRFIIVCLIATTVVSVSAINSRYRPYTISISNSQVYQNVSALTGKGNRNAHNTAIVDGYENNRVTNINSYGSSSLQVLRSIKM